MQKSLFLLDRHGRAAIRYFDVQSIRIGRQSDPDRVAGLTVICMAYRIRGGFDDTQLYLSRTQIVEAQLHAYSVYGNRDKRHVAEVTVDGKAQTLQEVPPFD
jgi:hypothetical protein